MKKIFMIVLALTLGVRLHAQTTITTLAESQESGAWQNHIQETATYDVNHYLIQKNGVLWDVSLGSWENSLQVTYLNNADGTINESVSQHWISGAWQNEQRTTCTYNGAGKVLTTLNETWTNNAWQNSSKQTDVYDVNNYQTQHSSILWDDQNSVWVNFSNIIYTNNSDGSVHQELTQVWDSRTSVWRDTYRQTNSYTPTGKILAIITESNQSGNWENESKRTYVYDTPGNLIEFYNADWVNGAWSVSSRTLYMYDAHDNLMQELQQHYTFSNNTWTDFFRLSYKRADVTPVLNGSNQRITLYPNPTVDLITIQGDHTTAGEVYYITDAMGRLVLTGTLNENTNLSLAALTNGVYFLRVGNTLLFSVIKK